MKSKFCVVTNPRSYSTVVCSKLMEVVAPAIEMPGPPKIGFELLHYKYLMEVADLYRLPFDDDERGFIDAYYAREPQAQSGLRRMLTSLAPGSRRSETFYVGFKTFPQFHHYNEFFDRDDIRFIVLHRENLDMLYLSWIVALYRENFGDTFDAKLADLTFTKIAEERPQGPWYLMRNLLFNLRVMSRLLERGAIELRVDENERIVNSPELDEYFGRTIDFSDITHRSDYSALPDMDVFQERFRDLLQSFIARSGGPSMLVEAFMARRSAASARV